MSRAFDFHPSGRLRSGFSLVEVLVASAVASIALVTLLQFLAFALVAEVRMDRHWKQSLDCWNQAQRWRASPDKTDCEWMVPDSGVRPLRLRRLEGGGGMKWEVLDAD